MAAFTQLRQSRAAAIADEKSGAAMAAAVRPSKSVLPCLPAWFFFHAAGLQGFLFFPTLFPLPKPSPVIACFASKGIKMKKCHING